MKDSCCEKDMPEDARFWVSKEFDRSQILQILSLYRHAGWWPMDIDNFSLIQRMIDGSHYFMAAMIENEIVGMGRAISDKAADGYIQDVVVCEKYRGYGIGTRIVQELTSLLMSDGITWVGLIAEGGSHSFYEQIGFQKMPDAVPMIKIITKAAT